MRYAAAALAVVVLLSGCSFLGGSGTPTGASPTGTPAGSPAADQYPAGYAADGVTNATAALEANTDALLAADSFFLEYNGTAISGDRTASVYSAQVVNLSADRAYVISRAGGRGSSVQYFAGGEVYVRSDPPGENNTRYYSQNASVAPREFTGRGLYGPLLRHVEWGQANRTGENDSLLFYRAESLSRAKPVLGENVDPGNVTDFSATLLVGPDGTVYRVTYGATIERAETSEVGVAITTKQVGNTTVEEPSWLDRARS